MNKREENRYSMFRAVDRVLHDHQDVVDTLPALTESVDSFRTAMQDISEQDNAYKNIKSGATDAKNAAEDALIDAAQG